MQYKLVLEIAAFILLVVILFYVCLVRQFPTHKVRVLFAFILVSILESLFHIVSVLGLADAQFVPQMVNELFAFAFFAIKCVLLICFMMKKSDEKKKPVIEVEVEDTSSKQYQRRKQVEFALNAAVEERRVEVYFQPVYSLKEKQMVALEALVHIKDEQLGVLWPEEFIPVAAETGSMLAIGEIIIEHCCRFLAKHILPNDSLGIRTLRVKVSKMQCMQQHLKNMILPILEKYHIPPSMLTLEVTDGMGMPIPEQMRLQLLELDELGVGLVVDDYGIGNYNLFTLTRLPFRGIKLNQDITRTCLENETERIILENEIQTLKRLGHQVVVAGVETKEQAAAIVALGVNYIQGDYCGKAMPEKECLVYIRKFYDER